MINNHALDFSNVNILWDVHLEYCLPTETNMKKMSLFKWKKNANGQVLALW